MGAVALVSRWATCAASAALRRTEIRSTMNVAILSLLLLGCVVHHCDCLPREVDDGEMKAELSSLLHRLTDTDDKSNSEADDELTPVLRSDNDTDELVPIPADFQSDDESDEPTPADLQDDSDESDVAPVGVTQRAYGYVVSPGYSSNRYPNNYQGYWRAYTSSGYRFRVSFTVLSLEYHSRCAYDSVSLYDGYTRSSRLIGKYCRTAPRYIYTTGRYIYLYFKTDYSVNRGRFRMVWQTVRRSTPPTGSCGVPRITPSISTRIVRGSEARRNSWPWQCYLTFDFRPSINWVGYCGGTVISNRFILTAAHCLYRNRRRVRNSGITVKCGIHNRRSPESTTQTFTGVYYSYVHERYGRAARFDSDVAVLRLRTTLRFNNYVQPVCLARSQISGGTRCVITGWGATQNTGSNSVLRQAAVSTLSLSSCRSRWGRYVTSNMQCASTSQGRGICFGDSGGPLVCKRGSRWYQYGISSWVYARNCVHSRYPNVFANVASLRSWIQRKTGVRSSEGMESDDGSDSEEAVDSPISPEGLEFEDDSDSEDGSEELENKLDGSEVPIKPYGVGEVPLDDDDPEPAAGDLYAAEKELLDDLQRKFADD